MYLSKQFTREELEAAWPFDEAEALRLSKEKYRRVVLIVKDKRNTDAAIQHSLKISNDTCPLCFFYRRDILEGGGCVACPIGGSWNCYNGSHPYYVFCMAKVFRPNDRQALVEKAQAVLDLIKAVR